MDLTIAATGLGVGILVGLTSTGGGALLTPALVLGLGVPAHIAVGSDVVIAAVMKLFGSGFYVARQAVDWPLVRRLATGSIPGAGAGLVLLSQMPPMHLESVLRQAIGGALVLVGIAGVFQVLRAAPRVRAMPSAPRTVALGFLIGLLVSTTSVGGGSLLLVALMLWYPLEPSVMVGSDLVHGLALTAVAGAGHITAGRVDLVLCAQVLAGAVPGVIAGASLATRLPQRALKGCLAAMLVAVGLRLAGG